MAPDIRSLGRFLSQTGSLVVLSGAGVSTASGIPDYRDRDGNWKHSRPIQFEEFARSEAVRKRYWARSYAGWPRFAGAAPGKAHQALAELESAGKVDMLITQNVDRLHSRAGSQKVIDLHGDLGKVRCLDCNAIGPRSEYQQALRASNPGWHALVSRYRADGDAELVDGPATEFTVPACTACGGVVKPDVVMFGESVPKARVQRAMDAMDRAEALLVVGSSLMVFSGFRFARRANFQQKPIAIVNQGRTRADDMAALKIDGDCAQALSSALSVMAA